MRILRSLSRRLGIRSRTLSSAWALLRTGDVRGIFRRSFRRLAKLRPTPSIDHAEWRRRHVDLTDEDRQHIRGRRFDVRFEIRIDGDLDHPGISATLASLEAQLHEGWTLEFPLPRDGTHWTVLLEPGVVLHEAALWTLAEAISTTPGLLLTYTDHDHLDKAGLPTDPWFLPGWNPELFSGIGCLSALVARHPDVKPRGIPDLDPQDVLHLPFLLASRPGPPPDPPSASSHRSLDHSSVVGRVSVLIPTRDQGRLLGVCLSSIRRLTTYPDVELVVIDHETTEDRARQVLDDLANDPAAVVLEHRGPFNFATLLNRAAEAASGDILVLLNNDTEVVSPEWLDYMCHHLNRPEVGIVGALLLFGNGTIQHAGVHPELGGLMGHGHKHLPGDDPGHLGRLRVPHRVAAVTGACLAIRAEDWRAFGGLDEELAVAYNDVDLCLKARESGLAVLLEPRAVLRHHESISRGYDDDPVRRARLQTEVDRMKRRWGDRLNADPAYNPNLSFAEPGFTPASPPRCAPPWRLDPSD